MLNKRHTMTMEQKLKANRKILEQVKKDLAEFEDRGRPVRDKFLVLFPNSTPDEVRGKMIAARKADIRVFEHIIADYETKLQTKEG